MKRGFTSVLVSALALLIILYALALSISYSASADASASEFDAFQRGNTLGDVERVLNSSTIDSAFDSAYTGCGCVLAQGSTNPSLIPPAFNAKIVSYSRNAVNFPNDSVNVSMNLLSSGADVSAMDCTNPSLNNNVFFSALFQVNITTARGSWNGTVNESRWVTVRRNGSNWFLFTYDNGGKQVQVGPPC